ncbi:UDP-glucose 4-epimerase family protein [Pseudomonas sp. H3_G09]
MTPPKVLVTGANGFVGEALAFRLLVDKVYTVIAAARGATRLQGLCQVEPFDLNQPLLLSSLRNVEVVVHCAARVHVMNDSSADPLNEFREVNVQGTLRLARSAAASGVKRFIFISSIKVNGESTQAGKPFTALDQPNPSDSYGVSKYEAEIALQQLACETAMEVVVIRPPLVYGPGVKANFLNMLDWLDRGVPLPLGSIYNRRSLVAINNLISLIVRCIDHPAAANQTFLVSDGEDLSTSQLLRRLSEALGKPARLLPVPEWILKVSASIVRKSAVIQRLCGSLQVDIQKNRDLLGWTPPVNVDTAMRQTAGFYKERRAK